jgi:uroporphyrin-III C-methyltransferase/precorrin-2 dehydrogenase/sirohydrochlorin ferrochelatase
MDMTPTLDANARTGTPLKVSAGAVWMVGTGPGDPDLLTIGALRRMQQADVALYDNLVSEEILAMLPASVQRIYVGKQRNQHAMQQEQINALMVDLARRGQRVLRLKGGDPLVFGRGGEEIASLAAANVAFEVVPGITAAIGASAYAGIPLTHRDCAQSCTFVTGHLKDGSIDLDWPALARPRQTVVVYMGLMGLPQLCARLIEHGRAASTPAAIVQEATRPGQRIVVGTLETLAALVARAGLRAPTVIVVGEVVAMRREAVRLSAAGARS